MRSIFHALLRNDIAYTMIHTHTPKVMSLMHTAHITSDAMRCGPKWLCRKTTPLSFYIFQMVNKLARQMRYFSLFTHFARKGCICELNSIKNAPKSHQNHFNSNWNGNIVADDVVASEEIRCNINECSNASHVLRWPIYHVIHRMEAPMNSHVSCGYCLLFKCDRNLCMN